MKKINMLVIAPHEDDELVIAGPMLYAAVQKKMSVKVVFVTNGDYNSHEGPIRMREAVNSLGVLGVSKENIVFLGYGDQTQGRHLYNGRKKEVICSHSGRNHTYGTKDYEDFALLEYGKHHPYSREYYKMDIKEILKRFQADVVITTDWDDHMDHIGLSLMVDECMGELLKETSYQPLLLKAQAYTGKWEGDPDYYSPQNLTRNINRSFGTEKVHPLNKWEDRIRFAVPGRCNTMLLKDNVLYRAAKEYKSQGADIKALQFINSDIVYWRRRTEGLTYHSKITVSSGQGNYLNDFKCLDCSDIVSDYRNYDTGIWVPEADDNEKTILIEFDGMQQITEICLYENPDRNSHIRNIYIEFSDGSGLETGELQTDGSCTRIFLRQKINTNVIKLRVLDHEGEMAGLTEVEVYAVQRELTDYPLPLSIWTEEAAKAVPKRNNLRCRMEMLKLEIIKRGRGRIWPNRWLLMQKYEGLQEQDPLWRFWKKQIRFIFDRIYMKTKGK